MLYLLSNQFWSQYQVLKLAVLLALLPLLAGCGKSSDGPERGDVRGKITVGGQPLEYGAIIFYPTAGTQGPSAGGQINDGKYAISTKNGPIVGKNRIEITGSKHTGETTRISTGQEIPKMVPVVPAKYNTNSELVRDIESGKNTLDFALNGR